MKQKQKNRTLNPMIPDSIQLHKAEFFLRSSSQLAGQEIPSSYVNQKFITMFSRAQYWTLSWVR
jgi:hypothetical protein